MQSVEKRDRIPVVRDGFLICPYCGNKIQRVTRETTATSLPVFCRRCKREFQVNIDRGESF